MWNLCCGQIFLFIGVWLLQVSLLACVFLSSVLQQAPNLGRCTQGRMSREPVPGEPMGCSGGSCCGSTKDHYCDFHPGSR